MGTVLQIFSFKIEEPSSILCYNSNINFRRDDYALRSLSTIILSIPAVLIGLTFHEYAHALVADRLGDKTPKFQGRLTLNPLAHIDIIGFLMILVIGFGWAKPVETNPSSFRHYYKDDLKVSVAGPLANLVIAFVFAILTGVLSNHVVNAGNFGNVGNIIINIFDITVQMNCMLFVFNLVPLPGLDGFHILRDLFPKFFYSIADFLYTYQMIILIVFVVFLAQVIIWPPTYFLYETFMSLGFAL